MKASIQAVRAITGVYFKRLMTKSVITAGVILGALWALVIWLGATADPLWLWFILLLVPLTLTTLIIYRLLLSMGDALIPRPLTKRELQQITTMGDKVFSLTSAQPHPFIQRVMLVSKDVLRDKESAYIKQVVSDTESLRDDFLAIRALFL